MPHPELQVAPDDPRDILRDLYPYSALSEASFDALLSELTPRNLPAGIEVFGLNDALEGLHIVGSGAVLVRDANGTDIAVVGPGQSFGERGLLSDGNAVTLTRTLEPTQLWVLPTEVFHQLRAQYTAFARYFDRDRSATLAPDDLASSRVETLMNRNVHSCPAQTPAAKAARLMAEAGISSLCVTEGETLTGIVTLRDLSDGILALGRSAQTPIAQIMSAKPHTLGPEALGLDVLYLMSEHRLGHVPITQEGRLLGMVSRSDLTRFQALSAEHLVTDIARAGSAAEMALVTAYIPKLLVQLVASGRRHDVVTRLITDLADAATRRLITLAEAELGPPPAPYLWLACGSQGRQEQTGTSDQDNCMIIDDSAPEAQMGWYKALAEHVCAGLDHCGYVFCPGEMMASSERWRQKLSTWRGYFHRWITQPDPKAQMLASVMFDLRPIHGERKLFSQLRRSTLTEASNNSIFVAHMMSNALGHAPPLALLRGFSTIRSGPHRDKIDMKHNGVVPLVDLGRVQALRSALSPVNTRARLAAAVANATLSATGGQALLDAYDLIAQTRLDHQVRRIQAGNPADNYLKPADLSELDKSHLRDAFLLVKSLQSALGHGKASPG